VVNSVVLLNSGGIDSRVSAALLRRSGMDIHSLFIDWNRAARERSLQAAQATADMYCTDHLVFQYPDVDWMQWRPLIGKHGMPYTAQASLVIGAQYAAVLGTPWIASGVRREIARTKDLWVTIQTDALNEAAGFGLECVVLTPVWEMTDDQVWEEAERMGVDLSSTWSCCEFPACGTCADCKRRTGLI